MSTITQFPKEAKFKYPWRNYQERVLKELEKHLDDRHLHVVAPPGSGKTVLGLEVALRLNNPTLILAPSVAIRNQWVNRFCELFLQTDKIPDWISKNIHQPKFLTVVTYQGLHAACTNEEEIEVESEEEEEETTTKKRSKSITTHFAVLIDKLKQQSIGTIVIDEAHHLKNEWWKTLDKVKSKLSPFIVGLTATPPYDVSFSEWERYLELNGAVDTEITVPELVSAGDLCPHQDYIHFSMPDIKEQQRINELKDSISLLLEELKQDEILTEAIQNHPLFISPEEHLDYIYNNISFYSSILIYLNNKADIPVSHFELIGVEALEIPELDAEWLATLLEYYLFKGEEHFETYKKHRKEVEKKLRKHSVIDHKKINFTNNKTINGLLTSSISKLNAIEEISNFEYQQLGKELRLVVLTDYIRKEFLTNDTENNITLNKIGVASIFEKLRRSNTNKKKIGVLTGSVVIIPISALSSLEQKNIKHGIESIDFTPLPYDGNYLQLSVTEKLKQNIVHTVTELFQEGEIVILIGTKALLGEGWDAPAVNSLILASFIGSFVLSNQMRGRAIRSQKGNPLKTGNVWHLACIDLFSDTGGKDLELMARRFKSFVGLTIGAIPSIESGVERLEVPKTIHMPDEISRKNADTFSLAAKREHLSQRWKTAVTDGSVLLEQIKIPFPVQREKKTYKQAKTLYYNKTIKNILAELSFGLLAFSESIANLFLRNFRSMKTLSGLYTGLTIAGFAGLYIFGRKIYKTGKIYFSYRDITKDIQPIAQVVFYTLCDAGLIKTPKAENKVVTTVDENGAIYCYLLKGTTYEKSVFINSLQEILTPIDNPRYIIIRKSKQLGIIKQRDYHAVPEELGRVRKTVSIFEQKWKSFVGQCEIVFTRNPEGRKLLIQSRIKALSSQFEDSPERVNKWR